ncbi:MAG: hypothetical protein H6Q36_141 [Chloroflexi bacterium]|jgi:hypothetical protein|nr:hypothetical protein [Chloroflexota bacterium]
MRRPVVVLLTAALLAAVSLPSSAVAARPAEPYLTRLTGTARWVTDTGSSKSYYILEGTLYARNVNPRQDTHCVTVTYPDGTRYADSGGAFPRADRGAEVSVGLWLGEIPLTASSVTVTAQMMRIGSRGCCTPVGPQRVFSSPLPTPPAPPPATSQPIVVFDVMFAAP